MSKEIAVKGAENFCTMCGREIPLGDCRVRHIVFAGVHLGWRELCRWCSWAMNTGK